MNSEVMVSTPRTEPGRQLRAALESIGVRDPERGMIVDAEAAAYALGIVHGRNAATQAADSRGLDVERLARAMYPDPLAEGQTWDMAMSDALEVAAAYAALTDPDPAS